MKNNIGGRNIVQPTGGSRGGWMGKVFGMLRAAPMLEMQQQIFGAQQEKVTEEMQKRAIGAAAAKVAGQHIDRGLALEHAKGVHNTVYERYGADHPDVVAGHKTVNDFVYPGMAAYGMPEDPNSMEWGSRSAAAAALAKQYLSNQPQKQPVGNPNDSGDDNNPPPPPPSSGGGSMPAGGGAKGGKRKKIAAVEPVQLAIDFTETPSVGLPTTPTAGNPPTTIKQPGIKSPRPRKPKA